ncbi:hypothetical protein V6C27_06745 [Peptococcaceae bacterium 1198_IL3148]
MLNLTRRLVDQLDLSDYQDQLVSVIYSCGDAVIKATGVLNLTGVDFIELVERNPESLVRVQILLPDVEEQRHHRVLIPLRAICSIAA